MGPVAVLSPLRLDVSEILDRPGASRPFREHVVVPAVESCPEFEVDADLRVDAMPDGLVVHGTLKATAAAVCSRCLTPTESQVSVDVHEVFLSPGEETEEEEAYPLEGEEIDLEPVIRESVSLSLPAHPICREDCPGLCSMCGVDLSNETCDCKRVDGDPRLAVLAKLNLSRKD